MYGKANNLFVVSTSPHSIGLQNSVTTKAGFLDNNPFMLLNKQMVVKGFQGLGTCGRCGGCGCGGSCQQPQNNFYSGIGNITMDSSDFQTVVIVGAVGWFLMSALNKSMGGGGKGKGKGKGRRRR